jgi:chemotaxis protein CheZ
MAFTMASKPKSSKKTATAVVDPQVKRIGEATARLHSLLKELGYSKNLEKSAATMTDARDRLSFIDRSMHEASEKTITAVEASLPLLNANRDACGELAARLADASASEHGELVNEAASLLREIAAGEAVVYQNLVEIMETQEFRDVAGQMVNKIVGAAVEIENILLDILKEYAPDTKDSLISKEGLLAGPNVGAEDSISGQDEVDDLLSSLGL